MRQDRPIDRLFHRRREGDGEIVEARQTNRQIVPQTERRRWIDS